MKMVFGFTAIALMVVTLALAAPVTRGINPQDISGKPELFYIVTSEPDPLLLGGWQCVHHRYDRKAGRYFDEPVEYWLVKSGDRYALYFFRIKAGEKTYKGWRECTINGSVITSPTGFKITAENGQVFYHWGSDEPTKMTRMEGN